MTSTGTNPFQGPTASPVASAPSSSMSEADWRSQYHTSIMGRRSPYQTASSGGNVSGPSGQSVADYNAYLASPEGQKNTALYDIGKQRGWIKENDSGMWGGIKDAFFNPATLAAAGAFAFAPAAAGTASADTLPGFASANSSMASTAYTGVAPSATSLTAANLAEGGAWGAGSGVAASGWGGGGGGNEAFGGGAADPGASSLYDVMPGAYAAASGATGGIGAEMSAFGPASVGNFFGGLSFKDDLAIGSGLYGIYSAEEQRRLARQASRMQDPFASQRDQYQKQLAALSANPGSVTSLPGYKFGMDQGTQAIMRNQASTGYTGSGNEAIALQKYGQDYAGRYLQAEQARLAGLAGGGIQPYGAGNSLIQGNAYATDTMSKSLASLGFGLSGKWGNTTNASLFA